MRLMKNASKWARENELNGKSIYTRMLRIALMTAPFG